MIKVRQFNEVYVVIFDITEQKDIM